MQVDEGFVVNLHDQKWVDKQRVAGNIASAALNFLVENVNKGYSLMALDSMAEVYIRTRGGIPTFKGYKGFPGSVCMSVNNEVVHGVPKDVCLKDGDIVTFDLGVTIDGAIADTAITCVCGDYKNDQDRQLVNACEEALFNAISAIKLGERLGVIGNAIYKTGKKYGLEVVVNYGGHFIDWDKPHAPPFIGNKQEKEDGIRFVPGMTFAIEPIFAFRDSSTRVLEDKWTVVAKNNASHFEHSLYIDVDGVEVVTYRGDELYLKNRKIFW